MKIMAKKYFLIKNLLTENTLSLNIDISNLPNGFYFITFRVENENISFTKKLIKVD